MFNSYFGESILARAIADKKIAVSFINPRLFVTGKYRKVWPDGNVSLQVDERPYGGGPGMIMRAEPVLRAIDSVVKKIKNPKRTIKIIFFSPSGDMFDTAYAKKTVAKFTDVILISGRYEGIDARVKQITKAESISIGDYVLTGGELPSMVVIDCMARQVEGVLGNFDSREEERVSSADVYTRPEILVWKKKEYPVPPVLLGGDHKKIEEWKKAINTK